MPGDHASRPLARLSAAGWGAVALGLVAIVAMAAHGAAWSDHGGGEVRSLPRAATFAGAVVAAAVAAVLFLLVLIRAGAPETAEQRRRRWSTAIAFLVLVAAISVLRAVHPSPHGASGDSAPASVDRRTSPRGEVGNGSAAATWWPLVIVGLGTALAVVAATARRRDARSPAPADTGDATIALLDASLDDLRSEPDPRRAVVAAYARMERGLAAHGFARQASETPTEYLRRALTADDEGPLDVRPAAVRPLAVHALGELTALAERARFSPLPIDETMRARAIEALEELRRELRRDPGSRADLGRVV